MAKQKEKLGIAKLDTEQETNNRESRKYDGELRTISEFIIVQSEYAYWIMVHQFVESPGRTFNFYESIVFAWMSCIDWSIQELVSITLRTPLIHQLYHARLAKCPYKQVPFS